MTKTLLQQTFRPLRRAGLFSMLLASTALAQVPTNNLVGIYPMEGNGNDVSGAGNNLIFNGTATDPSFGPDRFGNPGAAMHFNGAQFVKFPTLNLGNDFTMTFWLKSEVVNTRQIISGGNYLGDPYQFLDVEIAGGANGSDAAFSFRAHDGSTDANLGIMAGVYTPAIPATNPNGWYFFVVRNDNGTLTMHIDGIQYNQVHAPANMNSLDMILGMRIAGSYNYQGSIDDLTIHAMGLTNEELTTVQETEVTTPPTSWSILAGAYSDNASDANTSFGASEAATDGYDSGIDLPAVPAAPSPYIRVFLSHPEYNAVFGDDFYTDVRGWYDLATTYKTWQVVVAATVEELVTVQFNLPVDFEFPIRITDDETGSTGSPLGSLLYFSFEADGSTTRTYTVTVGDNTNPTLTESTNLTASKFFVAGNQVGFSFDASDASGIEEVIAEISFDDFATSDLLPLTDPNTAKVVAAAKGGNPEFTAYYSNAGEFTGNQAFKIRVRATDYVGNQSSFVVSHMRASKTQESVALAGWNLVGLPFTNLASKAEALADDFNDYYVTYNWSGSSYWQLPTTFGGTGFWLGASSETTISATADLDTDATLQNVNEGWQIIANPFVLPVSTSDIEIWDFVAQEIYSFQDAVDDGFITLPYGFNRATGNYEEVSELAPFSGQWFGVNRADLAILWNFPSFLPNAGKSQAPSTTMSTPLLSLTGRDKDGVTSVLSFGFDALATNGYDVSFDKLLPPVPPKGAVASIEGVSTPLGKRFSRLVYKGDEIIRTKMLVEGSKNATVVFSWTGGTFDGSASLLVKGVSYDLKNAGTVSAVVGEEISLVLTPAVTSNDDRSLPTTFGLSQNYPNPFNPSTAISYQVPVASDVKLSVFNMLGQEVAVLVNGRVAAGSHTATFDASKLSSGVYLYRMQSGSFVQMNKMTLLK